ncbi:MAG: 7TM domain-containing protein [Planctomycetota bacterium]
MSPRSLSRLTIVVFAVVGALSFWARQTGREAARRSLEDGVWRLTYELAFTAPTPSSELRFALPASGEHAEVLSEHFSVRGDFLGDPTLGGRTVRLRPSGTRERVLVAERPGKYTVTAEFNVRLHSERRRRTRSAINLTGDERAKYTRHEPDTLPVRNRGVSQVLAEAEGQWTTNEELLEWLFEYCVARLKRPDKAAASDGVLGVLDSGVASPIDRARTFATLCRAAGLPARLVTGFEVRHRSDAEPRVWVEVFRRDRWAPFDPEYGHSRVLPQDHVVARRDGSRVVRSRQPNAVTDLKARYSLVRERPEAAALRDELRHPLQVLDLTRLPVEMHEVLKLLLLLPFGALVTAVFRNVVGIATFGTFAPALFAVSFVYADWATGLLVLALVLIAGFLGRSLIERLRLLMVPRLSIILTTIILCVVFGVSTLEYLELTASANAVLLPLVIVTILIERVFVTVEEDGPANAARLLVGTLVVGACCYLVLAWDTVGETILVYPELHFLTIAGFVAIGRYTGYRLTELWRFRDLVEPQNG